MSPRPPLPRAHEVLTPESFARLAIEARHGSGSCLIMTVLDASGISTGDLVVVADLPDSPRERTRILARTTLYLHAAVASDWVYLAYAIVEPSGDRYAAFVVIEPVTAPHP
jgi:hypothetical protein